jgi:hypothetical protein
MNRAYSFLILILLSILAIFFMTQLHYVVHWISEAHQVILDAISSLIAGGPIVRVVRLSLALILIPMLIALIPAFIIWLIKRDFSSYSPITWGIWLVLLTILAYK